MCKWLSTVSVCDRAEYMADVILSPEPCLLGSPQRPSIQHSDWHRAGQLEIIVWILPMSVN